MGHDGVVVAPSLIPVKAGELTAVWVSDAAHEAVRDLVRARATAMQVLGKARQHFQGFLLRHGRIYPGKKGWTGAYRRWLTTVRFQHPAPAGRGVGFLEPPPPNQDRIAQSLLTDVTLLTDLGIIGGAQSALPR